jgi:hypothetical protein
MTAEIAVMNRQAIALAADSAVTVNYPNGQKIYNSVNKLFMLSKYAPVGIMVYGVADLTGVPWETIIKCFRRELDQTRLPNLQDYADRLIEYINSHKFMFSEANQHRQFITSVFHEFVDILQDIDDKIEQAIPDGGSVEKKQVRSIANSAIRERHSIWTKAERLPGAPADFEDNIHVTWGDQIASVADAIFEKLPLGAVAKRRLTEIACLIFTKDLFPDSISGVVVAGFGEDDYAPGVIAYDVEGVLLNFVKARCNENRSTAIAANNASVIIPFAQGEMVTLFMEGIDPRFARRIGLALDDFADGLADSLMTDANATGRREATLRKQINQAKDALTQKFFEDLTAYSENRHIRPIVTAVSNLPKEELAAMAESLVSLTSFKRRVTHDPETVGGPIDVAVISKGDGFIWIKRKHYFDPSLNHHFFANYYRN